MSEENQSTTQAKAANKYILATDAREWPRDRDSWITRFIWHIVYLITVPMMRFMYGFRVFGAENLPRRGPVLVLSSHQSFADPVFIGVAARNRTFFSLARKTLWDVKWLGWFITHVNAIPLDQDGADLGALRKGIEVLKDGRMLLLFPEGARTLDGEIDKFAPGMMVLVKRARPTIVLAAIEGGYDIWRRGTSRPKLSGKVYVEFSEPISSEAVLADGDMALENLRLKIDEMRLHLREEMGKIAAGKG